MTLEGRIWKIYFHGQHLTGRESSNHNVSPTIVDNDNDNDNDTLREVPHLSMRAWPYRQERRGHGPTKKDLS